jgi:predicted AAA+ superfamily ATPase
MNFKYYKRHLAPIAKKLLKEYPCLMVSGPRQVGKSTMIIEQVINND